LVTALRELMAANQTRPLLIGVCGRSRVGKSSTAHAVVRIFAEQGLACLHVRLDNWIEPANVRELNSPAETRNRVELMPELIRALRTGKTIHAPGYDAATRAISDAVAYGPNGQTLIVLDGVFAGHHSVRDTLDYVVFVEPTEQLMRRRFYAFYGWKGFDENAIEALWRERSIDEWPAVDRQRDRADLIIASRVNES
jgi:mannose-1-phosphate guanylyltransferase / phosphomannomutase